MTNFEETIEGAKDQFMNARAGLHRALASTPDDRLNWSPSPTARTPLEIAAHAADAIRNLHGMMEGRPFTAPTTAEADAGFRRWESRFETREEVVALIDEIGDAYLRFLDTVTPDQIDKMVHLPFTLGSAPLRLVITFPPMHTQSHIAQIDYIQTIYGDHVWH